MSAKPVFKRVVLKLSGEALQGDSESGINPAAVLSIAEQIIEATALGVQIALVIGGGNILRGSEAAGIGMNRATADYMGMLATVINALALQEALERLGAKTRVLSAISMQQVAETYIRRRAIRHMEKSRIVIFAGGTGNPYFTTDTTAALRAKEIGAEIVLKATKVDGIYSSDPKKDATAVRFKEIKYIDVLQKRLQVMDSTAVSLCMDHQIPIIVFNLLESGNIRRVLMGEDIGTRVIV